jgi:DNA repair exonuclease SbcCD ATPase subunit
MRTADTKLADRLATTEASQDLTSPRPTSPTSGSRPGTPGTKGKGKEPEPGISGDAVAKMRTELATTQKARSELEARLKTVTTELEAVKARLETNTKKLDEISREKAALERKVRDREHEIKEKGALLRVCHIPLGVSLDRIWNEADKDLGWPR